LKIICQEAAVVEIDTTRFGKIIINESELIEMKGYILGFEQLKRFVLLTVEGNVPFWWLQSVEDQAIAFVVINPRIVKPDYDPPISQGDFELLNIQGTDEIALLSITTIRSDPFRATTNLRAPILINTSNRWARQVIIEDPDYSIQYDLLGNKDDFISGLSANEQTGRNRPGSLHPSSPTAG
jgi:flagellar assembly factor FliW